MAKDDGYGILEQFKEAEHHHFGGPRRGGAPYFPPRPVVGRNLVLSSAVPSDNDPVRPADGYFYVSS